MTPAALDLTVLMTVFSQAGCTAHGKAPADDVNRAASDRNDLGAAPMWPQDDRDGRQYRGENHPQGW